VSAEIIDIKSKWSFNKRIMKNTAKLMVIFVFALGALFAFLGSSGRFSIDAAGFSGAAAQPTPPKKKSTKTSAANTSNTTTANTITSVSAANAVTAKPSPVMTATTAATSASTPANTATNTGTNSGKKIPKSFTLGADSQSEHGEAPFDHETHAFGKYSPDGTKVMGCVECHHTDQPKSAMQAPYVTSERDVTLTFETWQKSDQKVSTCRSCHFQDGNVPDGKTMPKSKGKDLNNQLAYHINCNSCHDAAYKLRPELKSRKGFATAKDCAVCHKTN
jgi:hypothetical protein